MNTTELITWETFKAVLEKNTDHALQFQYAANSLIDPSYHITEIKQAPIVSVDCGGVMNSWTEIIIQLWEPSVKDNERAMQVGKALSIVNLVEKSLPLNPFGIVKIEFGNSRFDTRQMYPAEFSVQGEDLIVNLTPDFTQCKAINRGGTCGTTVSGDTCCAPEVKKEQVKIEMVDPGTGCC